MLLITLESSFWIKANISSYNSCVFVCLHCSGAGMFMNISVHPHHYCSPQSVVSTQWVRHLTSSLSLTVWMFEEHSALVWVHWYFKRWRRCGSGCWMSGVKNAPRDIIPKQLNDYWECVQQHQRHILQTIWLPFSPVLTACYLSLEFALITWGVWHMTCWLECPETTPKTCW